MSSGLVLVKEIPGKAGSPDGVYATRILTTGLVVVLTGSGAVRVEYKALFALPPPSELKIPF
jgi:hypothetical protein